MARGPHKEVGHETAGQGAQEMMGNAPTEQRNQSNQIFAGFQEKTRELEMTEHIKAADWSSIGWIQIYRL